MQESRAEAPPARHGLLFDLSAIDLSARLRSKAEIESFLPHRGQMSLLDAVIWEHTEHLRAVAIKHVRHDEFWVPGHFPGHPTFPGVMMIEAGAQLACYEFMARKCGPTLVAFLRIEDAAFRAAVHPGEDLYLLCHEVKVGRRQFTSDIQGVVRGQLAFEARISGMVTAK